MNALTDTAATTADRDEPPSPPYGGEKRKKKKPGRMTPTERTAAILVSPTLLVLGLVVAYPILAAFRQSMLNDTGGLDEDGFVVEGEEFVFLQNYTEVFSDAGARFWNAFWNTTFFTVTTVTLETIIGVLMALAMHKAIRGRGLVRASVLVPWAVPTVISALMWRWIFAPDGIANELLGQQILWSADGTQAKIAVIVAEVWKTAPFVGLLVLAGLQVISKDIYEAAEVDGAGAWRRFWSITLPLVKPALLVAVLFRMLDAMKMFDLPLVLIGQQKSSVETLSMLAWEQAINVEYGPAAAYATILFVYVFVIALVFVKLLGADIVGEARSQLRTKKVRSGAKASPSRKAVAK